MSKASPASASAVAATKPVVPSIIMFGADVAERGINTSFDLIQDARTEIKSVADATIDLADTVTKSAIGFARKVVTRVDELAAAGFDQGKVTVLDVVSAARNTTARVSAIAADATTGAVGGLVGDKSAKTD